MDLSIVIPAFEEGEKIGRDVKAAAEFLRANRLTGEILVVDDGSSDGTKMRTGMKETTGLYAMFADCGLCIPYGNVLQGLEMLRDNACDIAHGSRRHIESDILQDQPWHRRLFSRMFKATVRTMLGVPPELTDTQCGFKIYRGDVARELYGQCISDGFMFDIEVILRAQKKGYRIAEFPVEWACDRDSRLSVTRTPWPVLAELHTLKRALSRENNCAGKPQKRD